MTSYAGLDVSQQETQICIIDAAGTVLRAGKARSEPAALAAVLRRHASDLTRAVLESCALSGWLCGGLVEAGLPAVCIDAPAAHGALKQRRNKTDRGNALGLARLAQTGWFKVVRLKNRASEAEGVHGTFSQSFCALHHLADRKARAWTSGYTAAGPVTLRNSSRGLVVATPSCAKP